MEKNKMPKHILITGGAGYIGTALTKRLLDEGFLITVFDNLQTGQRELIDQRAEFIKGDVCDSTHLDEVCVTNQFHTVIHLAALKSVGDGEKYPANFTRINVMGTLNILEVMKKNHSSRLVFSSSASVYQNNKTGIYDEECPLSAQSVYGATKLICEELIRQYERLKYINQAIIFRYFNLAGDTGIGFFDANAQNIFPMIVRAYLEQKPFSIFGIDYNTPDGTGIRDYIHLTDLIEAHVMSLQKNSSGIFNLGTQRGTSVKELIEIFNKHLTTPIDVNEVERRAGDVAKAVAISSKAQQEFGWFAKSSLEDMVLSTIETYNVQ